MRNRCWDFNLYFCAMRVLPFEKMVAMAVSAFLILLGVWEGNLQSAFSPNFSEEKGCDIRIRIEGVEFDTLWFGRSVRREAERTIAAVRDADGWWHVQTDEPLLQGMYAFSIRRMVGSPVEYFLCWLLDGERQFRIESNYAAFYHRARVEGSPENGLLFNYLHQHEMLHRRLWNTGETWRTLPEAHTWRAHVLAEEGLERYQRDFVARHRGSRTADLVDRQRISIPPTGTLKGANWQEEARQRFLWQRAHYFDRFDPSADDLIAHPILLDKLDQFLLLLPPADPGEVLPMADELLERLAVNRELYDYYLPYLIDLTEKIHRHRTEELYVHLVRHYAEKGKIPSASANQLQVWRLNANRLERLFDGVKAPALPLLSPEGVSFNMHDIVADWLLIVFWLPDCAHCRREIPKLIRFYEEYRDQGLQVLSVCGRTGMVAADCWKFVEQQQMPADWIVAYDPQRVSRFPATYNVRSYPHLLLLDRDKKIRYKLSGAAPVNTVPEVLERFFK